MKFGQLDVAHEFLLGLLHAPEDMVITGAESDGRTLRFVVAHPRLGSDQVSPVYTATRMDCGHDEITVDWGFKAHEG